MKALYPSSFSPISNGHIEVIKEAAQMFEHLYLVIANDEQRKYSTTLNERKELVEKVLKTLDLNNVTVQTIAPGTPVPTLALELGVKNIVRGIPSKVTGKLEEDVAEFWLEKNEDLIFNYLVTPALKTRSEDIIKLVRANHDYSEFVPDVIKREVYALWK